MMKLSRLTTTSSASVLLVASAVSRAASQDEVLKSINASVNESVDPTRFIAGAVMVVAIIVVSAVIAHKFKRPPGKPVGGVNHSGRLLKEITTRLRIRPAQMRQLKAAASEKGIESPLTLLLCPSLRNKPAQPK